MVACGKTSECRFPYCGRGSILRAVEILPSIQISPFVSLQTRAFRYGHFKVHLACLVIELSLPEPIVVSFVSSSPPWSCQTILSSAPRLTIRPRQPTRKDQFAIIPGPTNCDFFPQDLFSSRHLVGYHRLDVTRSVEVKYSNGHAITTALSLPNLSHFTAILACSH